MSSNLDTVSSIYAAFGSGDVPAILATLSPDVDWEYAMAPTGVPYLERRRGPDGVAAFFGALMENAELQRFVVKEVLAGERLVVALIDIELRVRATGRVVSEVDEVHVWRFDDQGRVARFRHALDSAAHAAAFRG